MNNLKILFMIFQKKIYWNALLTVKNGNPIWRSQGPNVSQALFPSGKIASLADFPIPSHRTSFFDSKTSFLAVIAASHASNKSVAWVRARAESIHFDSQEKSKCLLFLLKIEGPFCSHYSIWFTTRLKKSWLIFLTITLIRFQIKGESKGIANQAFPSPGLSNTVLKRFEVIFKTVEKNFVSEITPDHFQHFCSFRVNDWAGSVCGMTSYHSIAIIFFVYNRVGTCSLISDYEKKLSYKFNFYEKKIIFQ